MNEQEKDKEMETKFEHIKNIRNMIKSESEEPEIFMALMLYRIVKKWGLHTLPLRILHDLDSSLIIEFRKYLQENSK
jgi:hypothetical protein